MTNDSRQEAATLPTLDSRPQPPARSAYRRFLGLTTRWLDNDAYGHLNNAVPYSLFDSAVNALLIEAGALDPGRGTVIGLVVDSSCSYFAPLGFPRPVEAGLRVGRVGRSSIRYELGLFAPAAAQAAASGHLTHVYVDRASRQPLPLSPALRSFAETLA